MAAPNIVNVTAIYGKTALAASVATSSGTTVLTNSGGSNKVFKVNAITVANKTGSNAWITVALVRSSTDYLLAYQIIVPANASIVIVGAENKIYLEEGDAIKAIAGTATALDCLISYEDIS